jgi:hypothetical protein
MPAYGGCEQEDSHRECGYPYFPKRLKEGKCRRISALSIYFVACLRVSLLLQLEHAMTIVVTYGYGEV